MPSSQQAQAQAEKQYYLITNVHTTSTASDKEIDLKSQQSWQEPYTIDDADLMFDGKPLNLLYEENRWQAEHHVIEYQRDQIVRFLSFSFASHPIHFLPERNEKIKDSGEPQLMRMIQ